MDDIEYGGPSLKTMKADMLRLKEKMEENVQKELKQEGQQTPVTSIWHKLIPYKWSSTIFARQISRAKRWHLYHSEFDWISEGRRDQEMEEMFLRRGPGGKHRAKFFGEWKDKDIRLPTPPWVEEVSVQVWSEGKGWKEYQKVTPPVGAPGGTYYVIPDAFKCDVEAAIEEL